MSYDQKPSRMKLVSTGGPARTPENAATNTKPIEQAIQQVVENAQQADAAPARRFSLISAILFLAGCAIGGAGLAAWPYLAG